MLFLYLNYQLRTIHNHNTVLLLLHFITITTFAFWTSLLWHQIKGFVLLSLHSGPLLPKNWITSILVWYCSLGSCLVARQLIMTLTLSITRYQIMSLVFQAYRGTYTIFLYFGNIEFFYMTFLYTSTPVIVVIFY